MRTLLLAATLVLVSVTGPARAVDDRPAPIAEVMLVGMYHMHNPGADMFNIEVDDVLSETRQAEIARLTERLAEWRPDLVMVEWSRGDAAGMAARYADYRAGGVRDSRNEIMQLGFRLADRLDHPRLAAIDVQVPFVSDQQRLIDAAPDARALRLREQMQAYGEAVVAGEAARLRALSIGDYLAHMNSPESLTLNHDFYLRHLIRQWQDENQGGAHTVANWYTRNLLIFQNLLREVEEGDGAVRRVVVFYGQGHVPTLARFIEDTPWLTLADPLPHLAD
ncbi:hypothetical protein H0E84_12660 [Luteimonas sp. SJ-92]|uniref:TraB/GumN family protein n=1 Tax=Luteimonas salinisoli TaxID=2752307 RepID=A0A853JEP2_9GAMM|nr:DUF5694 domain-containing protein [Luteimonas salinisoli]NZA27234.1 hypothetical protein [Luteimonas salinisoli]